MHLLIPFAFCSSEGCSSALHSLKLPQLEKLLSRLTAERLDTGDELSLSPPHERALARALGLPVQDGLIPWAALQSHADGAWGFVTPCHWQVGSKHVAMSGPALADFPAQESQALLAAMQPYFAEDGITLRYDQPERWLARGDAFAGLATASLDRVVGRNVASWMPDTHSAVNLQRLQSEMQMLLYSHPVNDARAARGVPPVNSFWLSGTGSLPQPSRQPAVEAEPLVITALRDAALREDWAAWAKAWQAIDATQSVTLLAALDRGESSQLTLCGERNAQRFITQPKPILTRLISFFGTQPPSIVLEQL